MYLAFYTEYGERFRNLEPKGQRIWGCMQKLLFFGRSMRFGSPEFIWGKERLNSVFKQDYDHEIISTLR